MTFSLVAQNEAFIYGGQQFTGVHEKMEEWMTRHPGTHFDKTKNVTWINGKIYYHRVVFLSEEDHLIFKLTFSGHIL